MYNKTILVLSPHTDDGELGCGGSISKLIKFNDLYYAAFSFAKESVPKPYEKDILKIESKKALKILGFKKENTFFYDYKVRYFNEVRQQILEKMIQLKKKIKPEIIMTPSTNDLHQDHSVVSLESIRAFKDSCILGYELPWNILNNKCNFYITLDKVNVEIKIKCLKEYESQSNKKYFNKENITANINLRGMQINKDYAECFELIRWVL